MRRFFAQLQLRASETARTSGCTATPRPRHSLAPYSKGNGPTGQRDSSNALGHVARTTDTGQGYRRRHSKGDGMRDDGSDMHLQIITPRRFLEVLGALAYTHSFNLAARSCGLLATCGRERYMRDPRTSTYVLCATPSQTPLRR